MVVLLLEILWRNWLAWRVAQLRQDQGVGLIQHGARGVLAVTLRSQAL